MINDRDKQLREPILNQEQMFAHNNILGEHRGLLAALNLPTQQIASLDATVKKLTEIQDGKERSENKGAKSP